MCHAPYSYVNSLISAEVTLLYQLPISGQLLLHTGNKVPNAFLHVVSPAFKELPGTQEIHNNPSMNK
jgi:hypothetical protein